MGSVFSRNTLVTALEHRSAVWAIALSGLCVRICWLLFVVHYPLMSDSASYARMAMHLAAGECFIPYWPPGLPLYLAAVIRTAGSAALLLRFAMLPFYLGLIWALHRAALAFYCDRAVASLALLPIAFAPAMISASAEPMTELPAAFFLTLLAAALLHPGISRKSIGASCLAGLAAGCLALIRPSSLILVSLAALYLLLRSRRALPALLASVLPAILVSAWILYAHRVTGEFVPINTANSRNFFLGNNPLTPLYRTWWMGSHHESEKLIGLSEDPAEIPDSPALQHELSRRAWTYIAQNPGHFALRTFNRACVFFAPDTFTGAFVVENYGLPTIAGLAVVALDSIFFLALGLGTIFTLAERLPFEWSQRGHNPMHATLLTALCIFYAGPYFLAFSHPRYHFPIEPILSICAASAAVAFLRNPSLAVPSAGSRVRAAVIACSAAFMFIQVEFVAIILHTRSM